MGKTTFKFGELEVNRLGYGAMQLTGKGVFGEVEDRENAITVLREAVANGVNFIDTAEAYGPKFNESLIADALSPFQKDVFIATKGGFDPNVDIAKTLAPVVEAVKEGKIKNVGLSEVTIDQIKQVQDILPIVSVQNLYNLSNREWESVLDFTAEQGLAFIPWFPLASGPHKLEDKIKAIAEEHKATTAQIALAWLLKRSSNILLIPGTKSVEHLKENLKAAEIELTQAEFESLAQ